MHDFVMSIGYAVLEFFYSIDTANLLRSLSIMGTGMLGIFLVTGVIILVVTLLDKLFSKD